MPLTVVTHGKTGTGKTSTLNQLFHLNLATDHAVACTKAPQVIYPDSSNYKHLSLPELQVEVVDMPGIGEGIKEDEIYLPFYEEWIPKADSLVWVTQADTRAYKRDEIFLLKLAPLFKSSLFLTVALNKIDCFGVDEGEKPFDVELGQPSEEQLQRIPEKVDDLYHIFKGAIKNRIHFEKDQIIPYTSIYGWGLQELKTKILTRR